MQYEEDARGQGQPEPATDAGRGHGHARGHWYKTPRESLSQRIAELLVFVLQWLDIKMLVTLSSLYLLAASLGRAVAQPNLTALYGPGLSPGAEILYPSDADYTTEVTQRWNLYDAPTYFGAIKPATESDVQYIVQVSAQNNISFLATGRGHGSTSTLAPLNGIEIDLSNFRTINLDAENNRLTVGGSVNFSQLFDPLYNAGKMLRTSCTRFLLS